MHKKSFATMVASAATLCFLGMGSASATTSTIAHPATCGVYVNEGSYGTVSVVDGNGNTVVAGTVDEQYDYCDHARAAFFWNPTFRTTSHPGISGAWVNVYQDSAFYPGNYGSSGFIGSLSGTSVASPWTAADAEGEEWAGGATLEIKYSSGTTVSCWPRSQWWDYHNGNPVGQPLPATCKA
jgi:hypothetical protein